MIWRIFHIFAYMKRSQKIIFTSIISILNKVLLAMIATSAIAQVRLDKVKIQADTRLYLQILENDARQKRARSLVTTEYQQEAHLFVSCSPDADTKVIESQLKAVGARPQGTIGRYIMVSTPVNVVNKIAVIEGVTYISKGPNVSLKSQLSREVTGVNKVLQGVDGLPQAFTGKGIVVGVIDTGFDYFHPSFKDADGNLRIKALYVPGMTRKESDEAVTMLDGTELAGKVYTTPEEILAQEYHPRNNN